MISHLFRDLDNRYHLFCNHGTVLGKSSYSVVRVPIFLMEFIIDIYLREGYFRADLHKSVKFRLLIFNNPFSKTVNYAIYKNKIVSICKDVIRGNWVDGIKN